MTNGTNSRPSGSKPTICDFIDAVIDQSELDLIDVAADFREWIGEKSLDLYCPPEWQQAWAEYIGDDNQCPDAEYPADLDDDEDDNDGYDYEDSDDDDPDYDYDDSVSESQEWNSYDPDC